MNSDHISLKMVSLKNYRKSVVPLLFGFFLTLGWYQPMRANTTMANIEVHVTLSCPVENPAKSWVIMTMATAPFTVYKAITDSTGSATLASLPPGNYSLEIHRFNYATYYAQVNLQSNQVVNVQLGQLIKTPSNLEVNAISLQATWDAPPTDTALLWEDWSSSSLATNGWTTSGGTNWITSNLIGHSPPSAIFNWSPADTNYSQYLTSKTFPPCYASNVTLRYEVWNSIYSYPEYLSLEISNGSGWTVLKEYATVNGSLSYFVPETIDISGYAGEPFQIRFRAHGLYTYNINYWAVDNISIRASGEFNSPGHCPISYKIFVDNAQLGTTPDTNYQIPPNNVVYGVSSQVCVKAIFPSGLSSSVCASVVSQYLYPPRNFHVTGIENGAYIQWSKPQLANGTTPPGLTGYIVYRDGYIQQTFTSPDSLSTWALNLEPGVHYYTVNAVYDLSWYGQPFQTGYSIQAGPYYCPLFYSGCLLPFHENWDAGSFVFDGWSFSPSQGNWVLNTQEGNPAPTAQFNGTPVQYYYSYALVSPVQDFTSYSCADIFLDFDYKLTTNQVGSTEFLVAEIGRGGDIWEPIVQYSNAGTTGWVHSHTRLQGTEGLTPHLRFRAYGENSSHIESWQVDNILIYSTCYPPTVVGDQGANTVTLTWQPPNCDGEGMTSWAQLDDGSDEKAYGGTLLQDISVGNRFNAGGANPITLHKVEAYFPHRPNHGSNMAVIEAYTQNHEKVATTVAFVPPQNAWISLSLQAYLQPQTYYYVMVHYISPLHASNPVGYDTNGFVFSGDVAWVFNGVDWTRAMSYYGAPMGCFLIRVKTTIMSDSPNAGSQGIVSQSNDTPSGSVLIGYSVYRNHNAGPFQKINSSLVTDTTYTDNLPPGSDGTYCYYVTSMFNNEMIGIFLCEGYSDTLCYDFPVGLDTPMDNTIRLHPNPVYDQLMVESPAMIDRVMLINELGRTILDKKDISATTVPLILNHIPAGLYMVKIYTVEGVYVRKVIKN